MAIERITTLIYTIDTTQNDCDMQGEMEELDLDVQIHIDGLRDHSDVLDIKINTTNCNHLLTLVYTILSKSFEINKE